MTDAPKPLDIAAEQAGIRRRSELALILCIVVLGPAVWGLPQDGMTTGHMSSVGMLSAPVVLLMEARVSDRNAIGRRSVKKKYTVFNFGTGGAKGTAAPATNSVMETLARAGRFSWREILNWQELRNAMGNK